MIVFNKEVYLENELDITRFKLTYMVDNRWYNYNFGIIKVASLSRWTYVCLPYIMKLNFWASND